MFGETRVCIRSSEAEYKAEKEEMFFKNISVLISDN